MLFSSVVSRVKRLCPRCSGSGFRVLPSGPLLRVTPSLSHPASCHISVCPVRKKSSEILAKILTFYLKVLTFFHKSSDVSGRRSAQLVEGASHVQRLCLCCSCPGIQSKNSEFFFKNLFVFFKKKIPKNSQSSDFLRIKK